MGCKEKKQRLGKLGPPERNRYYYGKLLDERNLQMEQGYFNHKRWLLNRLGLGSGILCGLQVTLSQGGDQLCILPGVAIDALGREIIVHEPWCFDPWLKIDKCGHKEKREAGDITVCIAYHECYADYAPLLITDCNIREQCAPGTIRESFAVIILDGEPKPVENVPVEFCENLTGQAADSSERRQKISEYTSIACASASEESLIVLAGVTLNASKAEDEIGTISNVQMFQYRTTLYSNERLFDMILCLAGQGSGSTQGPNGDPGSKWYTGSKDPDSADPANAVIGDCYLNALTGDIFEKKSLEDWENKGNIRGPSGPQGIQGQPGLGLDPDLTKILDISWLHNNPYDFIDFFSPLEEVYQAEDTVTAVTNVLERKGVLPFIVYFNRKVKSISREAFKVRLKAPFGRINSKGEVIFNGYYQCCEIYGDVIVIDEVSKTVETPHTLEPYACAATFIPRLEFMFMFLTLLKNLASCQLDWPTIEIVVKGDFVFAQAEGGEGFNEKLILDGDNIGGRVGLDTNRFGINGGKNPSGNLTQGGDFESWLQISLQEGLLENHGPAAGVNLYNLSEVPVSINFAKKSQLIASGLTETLAEEIIVRRRDRFFKNSEDLMRRVKIKKPTLEKLKSKIMIP